jgi:hypothetical protein
MADLARGADAVARVLFESPTSASAVKACRPSASRAGAGYAAESSPAPSSSSTAGALPSVALVRMRPGAPAHDPHPRLQVVP